MKKRFIRSLCAVLAFAAMLPMAACGSGIPESSIGELQSKIGRQEEKLNQLEAQIKGLEERNDELSQTNRKLEKSVQKLENAMPYKVIETASTTHSVWHGFGGSYLFRTEADVIAFLNEVEAKVNQANQFDWHMYTEGGTPIDEKYFDGVNFNEKALVVSIVYSPCMPAEVTSCSLKRNKNKLLVQIEYEHGMDTAIMQLMVITEADQSYVEGIEEVRLELSTPSD